MTTEPHTQKMYNYQKQAVQALLGGKHIITAPTGSGKGAISMVYADMACKRTKKNKVLVVTTASKAHMTPTDYELDREKWCGKNLQSSLSVISWAKFSEWVDTHWGELSEWVVVLDEIAAVKNGVSSKRGRAFLKLAKRNPDWAGFTATPGENWLHFYPYFAATGQVKNKTQFLNRFAQVQTFKGFPEIIGWRDEHALKKMWGNVSYAPDVSQMTRELPRATHKVVEFKKPSAYNKVLKTRQTSSGELIDNVMKLCHTLRQECFTKDKMEWAKDFIENLGENAVIFYSYIDEGDKLEQVISKVLPKGARVWRVDGKHHEVPTEDTAGERDVILCQWQSGSEGLNLHWARYWVSTTPTYSYSTSVQARGRVLRIGSKKPVFYYYLKTKGTIEDDIYKALKHKQDFSAEVWATKNNLIKEEE